MVIFLILQYLKINLILSVERQKSENKAAIYGQVSSLFAAFLKILGFSFLQKKKKICLFSNNPSVQLKKGQKHLSQCDITEGL